MNIQGHEIKTRRIKRSKQADELAALTRELAHCCLDKEERICRSFGLHATDGRVLSAMLLEDLNTSSSLAERLAIGNSRITPVIDRLVRKGLVARAENLSDRRVRVLALTERGRAIAAKLRDYETELHEKLLASFTAAERDELLLTLHHLRRSMDAVRHTID